MSRPPSPTHPSADVPSAQSLFLRRRANQASELYNDANGTSLEYPSYSTPSPTSRRSSTRAQQNESPLAFMPRQRDWNSRPASPAPSSQCTPLGNQRTADEIRADPSGSTSIQRPASAPPRGARIRASTSLNGGGEDDESGYIDEMEKASVPTNGSTLSGIASETIEKFAPDLSDRSLALLFLAIVAWGAILSLDRLTTYSYQTIAVNSFAHHSSLAMINVIRAVIAAIAGIPFATVADLAGRAQAFSVALLFYAAGHATMAGSTSISSYVGGIVLYELGANALYCLQNTVLADLTSSRNRMFFQIVPQMPFLVFSFVSSDIYSAILPRWRWGIGMFAILGPAALLIVIATLGHSHRHFKGPAISSSQSLRRASLHQSASPLAYIAQMSRYLFQMADLVGLLLLGAMLSLLLVPLTLAASTAETWENPKILGLLATGIALIPIFCTWELRYARYPAIPKVLFVNRTFWGGAAGVCLLWSAYALVLAYFPTYLYVVHGVSNRAQQNFSVIYSFTVAAASLPVALHVRYTRRYKPYAVIGVVLFTIGIGQMIAFKGTSDSAFQLAASQVITGLGGALTIALIQAAVQVAAPPAIVARTTAAFNIFPSVGNAIGAAVAGAMWSNLLPGFLARNLTTTSHLKDLPTIYAEPLTWIEEHPLGNATRSAVIVAYLSIWRLLMIVGTIMSGLSIVGVLFMQNLRLNDSLVHDDTPSKEATSFRSSVGSSSLGPAPRFLGDGIFERFEQAWALRTGRNSQGMSKKSALGHSPLPPLSVQTPSIPVAQKSSWKPWGPFRRPNKAKESDIHTSPSVTLQPPQPSPVEEVGPAPILIVDSAPFEPPSCPPTPPAIRAGAVRGLSPLPSD